VSDQPPVPDPTALTTEQLLRTVSAERDYVDGKIAVLEQRLDAIDKATRLLNETVNRTPTEIQREVSHLRELLFERINAVTSQIDLMLSSSKEAIEKAEAANERRFEGINEWRGQSADRERSMMQQAQELASTYMPREVGDAQFNEIRRVVGELVEKVNKIV
jgi:uncharacterized protein YoxC